MDPNEIIKHAPELLKGGAALAGAVKLTDIIKAFLGPATAEIAQRFQDEVRLYRFGRQLACLKKAEQMAKDAGFTPKAVPIKLLFPLLEGASLEEDEDLHTMWAALLANASLPGPKATTVRPGFISTLRRLAPDEALFLNRLLGPRWLDEMSAIETFVAMGFGPEDRPNQAQQISESLSFIEQFRSCLDSLEAAQLIRHAALTLDREPAYVITSYGETFLKACEPPKPIS